MKRIINICKIADINEDSLSEEARRFLSGFLYYEDKVLKEDLFNLGEAVESDYFETISESAQNELNELLKESGKRDCAYIRIIYEGMSASLPPDEEKLIEKMADGLLADDL